MLCNIEDGGGVADELVDEWRGESRGSPSAGATFDQLAFTCALGEVSK